MSRVQLALNVSDLDEAISFYSKLFGTSPVKTRPGYANFAIAEPPLKLVLIEGIGTPGTLNHLGVEVAFNVLIKGPSRRRCEHHRDNQCDHLPRGGRCACGRDHARERRETDRDPDSHLE